jgi:tRNA1(Val) A37 N6-methylase TrmN6
MAERTVSLNHLNNRIRIVCGDVKSVTADIPICSFDAVVCNPPYTPPGTALASPISCRAISRTQETSTLSDFFSSAFRILKGKGKIFLIYPASGMLHIMNLLHQAHLEPKKFQLVYPYEHKPANLVLIEAVKDARPTLHPMPPLIVYKSGNELTDRLKSVYHIIGSCN